MSKTAQSLAVLRMVDAETWVLHFVRLDVAPLHRNSGVYPALCGTDVLAASLTAGAFRACRECKKRLAPPPAPPKRRLWLIPFPRQR